MTPFPELAASREYWLTKIQSELYACVEDFLTQKGWTRTRLAEQLNVHKSYVSQVLNGDFDHKLSKLIDLALTAGVVPNIHFQPLAEYIENYLSGYEGSLRAEKVYVTMQVVDTTSRSEDASYSAFVGDSQYIFQDNEAKMTYALFPSDSSSPSTYA